MVDQVSGTTTNVHATAQNGAIRYDLKVNQTVSSDGNTQSTMVSYRRRWSCTTAFKNALLRVYDWLCKCLPFLPKREQPVQMPTREESQRQIDAEIVRIKADPEYQRDPVAFVKDLLRQRGGTHDYRSVEDPVLSYFKRLHNIDWEDGSTVFQRNFKAGIENQIKQIEELEEYKKNPKGYLEQELSKIKEKHKRQEPVNNVLKAALLELKQNLDQRDVNFSSQNEVREFNQDSVTGHLYPADPNKQKS